MPILSRILYGFKEFMIYSKSCFKLVGFVSTVRSSKFQDDPRNTSICFEFYTSSDS